MLVLSFLFQSAVTPETGDVASASVIYNDPGTAWMIITAIATTVYALVSIALLKITHNTQRTSDNRWLALNQPWLRITFPDERSDPDIDRDFRCDFNGGPVLMRVENYGNLPTKLGKCYIEEFNDDNLVKGLTVKSSRTRDRIGGFLEGARLASGEKQLFYIKDFWKKFTAFKKSRFILILEYSYEAGKTEIWKVAVNVEQGIPPNFTYYCTVIDSTAD